MSVLACLRATLRSHVRASVALVLLVGTLGGVVVAGVASASRTDSALSRFLATHRASDVALSESAFTGFSGVVGGVDLASVARLPQVADMARMWATPIVAGTTRAGVPVDGTVVTLSASVDGRFGTAVDTWKLLHGRRSDPSRVDEITLGHLAAERLGLHVGDALPVRFFRTAGFVSMVGRLVPELTLRASGGRAPVTDVAALADGPAMTLRVVGIHVSPVELPPLPANLQPLVHLTPAFHRVYGDEIAHAEVMWVRLRRGDRDLDGFKRAVDALNRGTPVGYLATRADKASKTQTSLHLQANSFRLFAAVIALTGLLLVVQLFARFIAGESADHPILRAVGMTTGQLWSVTMAGLAVVAAASGVIAAVVAVALSPLTPIGLARTIETDTGFRVERGIVAAGATVVAVVVLLACAFPAWRASRRAAAAHVGVSARRPSSVLAALSRTRASVAAVTGVRFALMAGRDRPAVPARASIGAAAVAAVAIAAAATFGASLTHLIGSPEAYGATWDLQVGNPTFPDFSEPVLTGLAANPQVAAAAAGTLAQLTVEGLRVDAVAREPAIGRLPDAVLAGRGPVRDDEIVLGTKTLDAIGGRIGDTVDVAAAPRLVRMRIVGRAVFADIGDASQLGKGAEVTLGGLRRVAPAAARNVVWIRLHRAGDWKDALTRLQRRITPMPARTPNKPNDLVNFGQVSGLPTAVAGVFSAAGLAAVAHVLVSTDRRRRHELAVLRALGFVRGQVGSAIRWQARTFVVAALLVGLPVGVALGRWLWVTVADGLGVAPVATVPWATLLVLVLVALLASGALARLATRRVVRGSLADALRAE